VNRSEDHDSISLGIVVHIADVDGSPLCGSDLAITIVPPHQLFSATCQDCLDCWDDVTKEPGEEA